MILLCRDTKRNMNYYHSAAVYMRDTCDLTYNSFAKIDYTKITQKEGHEDRNSAGYSNGI